MAEKIEKPEGDEIIEDVKPSSLASDDIVNNPPKAEPKPEPKAKKDNEIKIAFLEKELQEVKVTIKDYEKKITKLLEVPKGRTLWEEIENIWD
jgi:hypothetical protein